ncbi:MAG: hypothetical protein BJ554DRAFT_2909 [Olpidium bornovanus]|uniref:Uncharacterized protein n=1 Tax=Olpidium bornovanus TaxID=278681 RepID=A0A8H7ZQ15_9FUNG|nr:MAG: hypothetical protein BJ554DRAFT_2909 [Olpidium bornovanus]
MRKGCQRNDKSWKNAVSLFNQLSIARKQTGRPLLLLDSAPITHQRRILRLAHDEVSLPPAEKQRRRFSPRMLVINISGFFKRHYRTPPPSSSERS